MVIMEEQHMNLSSHPNDNNGNANGNGKVQSRITNWLKKAKNRGSDALGSKKTKQSRLTSWIKNPKPEGYQYDDEPLDVSSEEGGSLLGGSYGDGGFSMGGFNGSAASTLNTLRDRISQAWQQLSNGSDERGSGSGHGANGKPKLQTILLILFGLVAMIIFASNHAGGSHVKREKDDLSTVDYLDVDDDHFNIDDYFDDGDEGEKKAPVDDDKLGDDDDYYQDDEVKDATTTSTITPEGKIIPEFHSARFGGIHNIHHPAGAKALLEQDFANIVIPPHGRVNSLTASNIINHWGHYVHDEHRSRFSSFLYDKDRAVLDQEQKDYEEKMESIRKEWGAWDLYDTVPNRPKADLDAVPYRDMKNEDFPSGSWQTDETYTKNFIAEARKLVDRTKTAIYKEYGHELSNATEELFRVQVLPPGQGGKAYWAKPGVALLSDRAFDGMARKLLHAMITNDFFFVVYGGHSAAAGHGNNFRQNQIMQFNHIMEPLMAKLGVKLISKNLCMGGYGTLHYDMGMATLYGEKDFLLWDSHMTEPEYGSMDFFIKQGIISGERVPLIMIDSQGHHEKETNGTHWHGSISYANGIVPETMNEKQVQSLPYAAQYLNCNSQVKGLCEIKQNKYHECCWEPRTDFEPSKVQAEHAGGQAGWHPGDRTHQFTSRKMAMVVLHSLTKALDVWEEGMKADGFPLKESYWHVGEKYQEIQNNLMTYMNEHELGYSECEKRFPKYPKVCRQVMSGITDFTPSNNPDEFNLHSRVKTASNGWNPWHRVNETRMVYDGMDLVPYAQRIPKGEVDVHAIVLATTYPPPDLDQSWDDGVRRSLAESLHAGTKHMKNTLLLAQNQRKMESMKTQSEHMRLLRSSNQNHRRDADEPIVPGIGWGFQFMSGRDALDNFCDGSTNSKCGRGPGDTCLLYSANDGHRYVSGDGLSGWLVIDMPKMKEGYIIAKLEYWHPRKNWDLTTGWTEVNNGELRRSLGGHVTPWPNDIKFDIAVNGQIVKTWTFDDLEELKKETQHNEAFYPMVDDKGLAGDYQDVELAFRLSSATDPRMAGFSVTHIYYA